MDDPQNQEEQDLSTYILDKGAIGLGMALLRETWRAPKRMFEALKVAFAMGRGSQAGVLRHLIYLAEAAVIAGMARENGYEHLHAHFGTLATTVARIAAAISALPVPASPSRNKGRPRRKLRNTTVAKARPQT